MWYEWEAVLSREQSSGEPDRCRQRILRQRAEFVIKDNCATSCARCSVRPSRSQATLSQTVCTYNHESSCPSFVWSPCQFSGGGCRYPPPQPPLHQCGETVSWHRHGRRTTACRTCISTSSVCVTRTKQQRPGNAKNDKNNGTTAHFKPPTNQPRHTQTANEQHYKFCMCTPEL